MYLTKRTELDALTNAIDATEVTTQTQTNLDATNEVHNHSKEGDR